MVCRMIVFIVWLNISTGTSVYVRDLFFKYPVRKKILMASNELDDIKQRIESIALAHPDISFSLYDRAKGTKLLQSKKVLIALICIQLIVIAGAIFAILFLAIIRNAANRGISRNQRKYQHALRS